MADKKEMRVFRVEFIDQEHKNEKTGETIPAKTEQTFYLAYGIGDDIIDYGDYWNYGEGPLYPYAEDGIEVIVSEPERIGDYSGSSFITLWKKLEPRVAHPGDWIESPCENAYVVRGRGILRVTRLADLPRLSVQNSVAGSCDLSDAALAHIRFYGRPLLESGASVGANVFWLPSVETSLRDLVKDFFANKFAGVSVDEVVGVDTASGLDLTSFTLRVSAPSEDALRAGLADGGVREVHTVKIETREGDPCGVTRVSANISVTTRL